MPKNLSVIEKLNLISEYQAQRDLLEMDKQKLIDEAIPPEVKAKLAEISAEFNDKGEAVAENIKALEAEIKSQVLANGESVKGANLHAVYMRGRISWDAKKLDGFAVAHPEILFARSEGEPSVSMRAVKSN